MYGSPLACTGRMAWLRSVFGCAGQAGQAGQEAGASVLRWCDSHWSGSQEASVRQTTEISVTAKHVCGRDPFSWPGGAGQETVHARDQVADTESRGTTDIKHVTAVPRRAHGVAGAAGMDASKVEVGRQMDMGGMKSGRKEDDRMARTHVCRLRCQDRGLRHRPFLDLWHLSSLQYTHPRSFSSVPRYRFPFLYKACVSKRCPITSFLLIGAPLLRISKGPR